MQVDHPTHRLLVVASVEHVFRGSRATLLKNALLFLDLHLDLINLVEASLVLEFENCGILLPDALSELVLLDAALLEVLVVLLVETALHPHEALHQSARPELPTLSSLRFDATLGRLAEHLAAHIRGLVTEHWERQVQNLINHVHIAEYVVQILQYRVG